MNTIRIIMCCSTLNTKGGMVSVVKNYLDNLQTGNYKVKYIPTHFNTNKLFLIIYFFLQFVHILWEVSFRHYDIAHLHVAERGSFWRKAFLVYFFHCCGIKVILHHHASEFDEFYNTCSDKNKKRINNVLAKADMNIVLSERLVSMIKDKQPMAKVCVLYNAVNTYPVNPYNRKARNILFLGRLGRRKGVFDLLSSIKELDGRLPSDVKFYLCGDQGEDAVIQQINELGIMHRISHVGWIDGDRKKEILKSTMLNCLPSYNEGLPMSILETMAAGIPNISTDIASIPEVITNNENGILITPGDIEALSQSIENLVSNDVIRLEYSEKSFALINDKFSLSNHMNQLKSIYNSLIS